MHKISIITLAAAVLGSSPALAINTYPDWDGSSSIFAFGCEASTEYGQVITIPTFRNSLGNFTFWMANYAGSGSLVMRGEVYQWDPANARVTGSAVWESAPRTVNFKDANFHHETFQANVAVTPGAQYVVFATVDKDYDKCTSRTLQWGMIINTNVYAKGPFVALNDEGDTAQWSTHAWFIYEVSRRSLQGDVAALSEVVATNSSSWRPGNHLPAFVISERYDCHPASNFSAASCTHRSPRAMHWPPSLGSPPCQLAMMPPL